MGSHTKQKTQTTTGSSTTTDDATTTTSGSNAAVVASALIDTLAANLDEDGKAKSGTVEKVLAQVKALADGVRG